MREIKFRAWDNAHKAMYYSDTGNVFLLHGEWQIEEKMPNGDHGGCRVCDGKRVFLMEYTGLKDKNGKDIYEGDIVRFSDKWEWYRGQWAGGWLATGEIKNEVETNHIKYPYEQRVVEFDEGSFCFATFSEIAVYWEVVGNIYEHGDLLKGGK